MRRVHDREPGRPAAHGGAATSRPVGAAASVEAGRRRGLDVRELLAIQRTASVEAHSLTTAVPIPAAMPEALIAALKNLPADVGRLFIIGHSGDIQGGAKPEGKLIFAKGKSITLDKLAAGVGSATGGHPSSLEFRGCRIGSATAGLDALRKALGAATASGSSCFVLASVTNAPVTLIRFDKNGKEIGRIPVVNKAQLQNAEVKAAFDAEFEKQLRVQLPAFNCIIGVPRTLTGAARTQALKDLYFRNNGQLEAKWVRDDGKDKFESDDPCFDDLGPAPKKNCSLVVVPKGGGGGGGGGGGKKACGPADRTPSVTAAFALAGEPGPEPDPDLVGLRRGDGSAAATADRRPRVVKLQGRLSDEGFTLDADGRFGGKTNAAVNAVQDSADLPQTQVVDLVTATVLAADASQIVGLTEGDGLTRTSVGRRRRVSRLQQLLTEHASPTKIDGKFGPRTLEALHRFQESVLLAPSDVVDAVTAGVLEGRRTPPEPVCDDDVPVLT